MPEPPPATPAADPSPALRLMELATGYFSARAVYVAAALGIPDLLAGGPRDAADLARESGTHAPALYRLLRALAAAGVLEHTAEDRFGLTSVGATLRADAAGSTRPGVMLFHHSMFWRSWEALLYSVQTGRPAFERVFGKPVFDYLAETPDAAAAYDGGMTGLNAALAPALAAAGEFARFDRIVDLAGGHGSLLAAILETAPRARGVLVDLPHVTEAARGALAACGLGDRTEVVTADLFESVPAGADAYVIKWILHDWSDERCGVILRRVRAAIRPDGRLLVIERILPERAASAPATRAMMMADLLMLVHLDGRERTEPEFRALLDANGFRLERIVPTASPLSIIEAAPA